MSFKKWRWTASLPWLALTVWLGYAAWARGGTRPELLPPMAVMAVITVGVVVLLPAIWLVLLVPALRLLQRIGGLWQAPPLPVALLVGTFLTLIHSLIDLPFRSPAILWLWLVCLACAPSLLIRGNRLLTLPKASFSRIMPQS